MQIPGVWRLKKGLRKIANRLGSPALVLMYHRVAHPAHDPWRLCVSAENFDAQMAWLKANCHVTTLDKLSRTGGKIPVRRKPTVAITFDDGYADNLTSALPVLDKHHVPATVFVSSGYIGIDRMYWWDDLTRVIFETVDLPQTLELSDPQGVGYLFKAIANDQPDISVASLRNWMPWEKAPTARHQLYYDLWKLFRKSDADTIKAFQNQLYRWANVSKAGSREDWPLDVSQLQVLANDPWIQIGGHTINHYSLQNLDVVGQRLELEGAKKQLEEWINKEVITFSYPFGDFTEESAMLVKKAGYQIACTTAPHCFQRKDAPYHIPRFAVENWSGEVLGEKIDYWVNQ